MNTVDDDKQIQCKPLGFGVRRHVILAKVARMIPAAAKATKRVSEAMRELSKVEFQSPCEEGRNGTD